MRCAVLLLILVAACRREQAPDVPIEPLPPPVPAHELALSFAEREAMPGVHVRVLRKGSGEPRRFRDEETVMFSIDIYHGNGAALSLENFRWENANPAMKAALDGMSVGEVRRVWFCSPEAKKDFGDAAKEPCVVADHTLLEPQRI